MTLTPSPSAPVRAAEQAPPARGGRFAALAARRLPLALVLGWVAQVALRVWFSRGQSMPVASPDELGYLFSARVLTGGPGADLSYGTVYRGGYPLLLAPAFWLAHRPDTVYEIMLVINALVSALMLPLGYLLLRRLGLTRRRAYVFGHVMAVLPAVLFFSEFALTDAVLPVVTLGWLLCVHSWLTGTGSVRAASLQAAGASALAAYAYACHTRGVLLLAAQGALLLAALALRWRPWRAQAAGLAALAAVTGAGMAMNARLLPVLYPHGDNKLGHNLAVRLTSPDGWGWTLGLATGQLWCQLAITGGMAGLGLLAIGRVAVRRRTPGPLRAVALALLAIVAGVAVATSAALPDEHRIGNYVYARYLAMVLPILFAVGVATLLRKPRRSLLWPAATTALALVGTAVVVDRFAGDRLSTYDYQPYDFPETSLLTWNWTEFRLWPATVAGLALLGLALLASRPRRSGPALVAALYAALGLAIVTTALDRISGPLNRQSVAVSDLRAVVPRGQHPSVAIDWSIPWDVRLPLGYRVWWTDMTGYAGWNSPPPTNVGVVFAVWDGRQAPATTWRGGAPAGWRVAAVRHGVDPNGPGFVAWTH
ncbi:hypothetical protein [Actinomadura rayongensis]|uniref:Phospholipid carrier-dependent glycosyltransferase n=1 Tax=Actinomadura rayongensis TaxID=1429076 RepID=A0A6I4W4Y5_9ACTN|nr:hypothetical protein [Actinomadura rayongensis]